MHSKHAEIKKTVVRRRAITGSVLSIPLCLLALLQGILLLSAHSLAAETHTSILPNVLRADFRHRPPEMVLDEQQNLMIGPLKDILEEAASSIGYSVEWTVRPFARSYNELQVGTVDIVPRTIRNDEREAFVAFLGPIATQRRDIHFLVKPGDEERIQSYDDLYGLSIGVKRGTAYFDRFNQDDSLNRTESVDDDNMARMFIHGRFDTMVILDRASIELALEKLDYAEYSYARYRYLNEIGNYYGMSRRSPHFHIFDNLNRALLEMAESGRVREIYLMYDLASELE